MEKSTVTAAVKRGRKPSSTSLRARIERYAKNPSNRTGRTLADFYRVLKAETIGEMAAIRGILNRFSADKHGLIQRDKKVRGQYAVNSKVA